MAKNKENVPAKSVEYYYDRYVKQDFEKPTIGILLCKEKKDTLVKLTLPEKANIYASTFLSFTSCKTKTLKKKSRATRLPFCLSPFS